jgi:pimeloyl-ACP methyl ester carboxylesterase
VEVATLAGINAERINTQRITTRVLFSGSQDGDPVLFLHGNVSSATWWEEVMLSLPRRFRGIAPDQRGFGAADPDKKIDATRGAGSLADDALALLDYLGIERAHVVGHSMGGFVVWRLLTHHRQRLSSVTLVAPASPFGFGGTKDIQGTPCYADFAGSGGGLFNPGLISMMERGDRGMSDPASPRNVLRTVVLNPAHVPSREEQLLSAMLQTHIGPRDIPGDATTSPNWPYSAPGVWGIVNSVSPKYNGEVDRLLEIASKPTILWVRGSEDRVISDAAFSCPGTLGSMGMIPGWPGHEAFPPQPMVGQTRAVLERYAANGGAYREIVMRNKGHAPFVEDLAGYNRVFHAHLADKAE